MLRNTEAGWHTSDNEDSLETDVVGNEGNLILLSLGFLLDKSGIVLSLTSWVF